MNEQRIRVEIDLPALSQFEVAALERLRKAAPDALQYEQICAPCTARTRSYINRLVVTGLVMQSRCEDNSILMSLTYIGEQVTKVVTEPS